MSTSNPPSPPPQGRKSGHSSRAVGGRAAPLSGRRQDLNAEKDGPGSLIRSQPGWACTGRGGAALFRPGFARLPGVPWGSERERRPRHLLPKYPLSLSSRERWESLHQVQLRNLLGAAVHITAILKGLCLSQVQWWSQGQVCCGGPPGHDPGCLADAMEAGARSRAPLALTEPAAWIL